MMRMHQEKESVLKQLSPTLLLDVSIRDAESYLFFMSYLEFRIYRVKLYDEIPCTCKRL
ncbi:hypothetical protein M378DRAFT_902981 [Amanita muscaria Koide BX008]|uniref:Uncharacterized protein n=1 Tax=Amanita muscaria (strain Koide BX008) TaxID=946122 RepID=A0A0C2WVR5_AMAMK|nr:hypothetical protein M378DRAFT_902981 [Amanita muscaria Koide BX008]